MTGFQGATFLQQTYGDFLPASQVLTAGSLPNNLYRLTIALCLYRSDYWARRAFFSAYLPVSQSDDIELLVLDNNPSAERADILSLRSDKVRYIAQPRNYGSPGNALRGWREARGEFVMFMGDDDFLDPFFFENICGESSPLTCRDCDVIASSPTEFEKHSEVRRLSRSADDVAAMADPRPLVRVVPAMHWRYSTYLLWAMYRRDSVILDVQFSFMANCPGYIVGLDWPTVDGIAIYHRIRQLNYGFYVYNRSNWDTSGEFSWMTRELVSFRKGLKGQFQQVDDQVVMAIRSVNMAAVALAYFLALSQVYQVKNSDFNQSEFLSGVALIFRKNYLSQIRFAGIDLDKFCQPSVDALIQLLRILCGPIVEHLEYGQKLLDYLLMVSTAYQMSSDQELFAVFEDRYADWHHVEVEGLKP